MRAASLRTLTVTHCPDALEASNLCADGEQANRVEFRMNVREERVGECGVERED